MKTSAYSHVRTKLYIKGLCRYCYNACNEGNNVINGKEDANL